jgi:hypothetical protein
VTRERTCNGSTPPVITNDTDKALLPANRLERQAGKLARAVLRGGGDGDTVSLPDPPLVPGPVLRQPAFAGRALPSAMTRAPAAGSYRWSEVYGYFDSCSHTRAWARCQGPSLWVLSERVVTGTLGQVDAEQGAGRRALLAICSLRSRSSAGRRAHCMARM